MWGTSKSVSSSGKASANDGGSLRLIVKQRVHEMFASDLTKSKKVLILDGRTTLITSHVTGMFDLLDYNVSHVEDISKRRAPLRDHAPIYFLTPTLSSIQSLIDDWTPSKARKQTLYANTVYLYLTDRLPDELMFMIKQCTPLCKRLKALVELNLDFVVAGHSSFHLDMRSDSTSVKRLLLLASNSLVGTSTNNTRTFSSNVLDLNQYIRQPIDPTFHQIANNLVTLCATINEYPHIRYRASSPVAQIIAHLFHHKFTAFISNNETWWYYGDAEHMNRSRGTLLLLSRADDLLSPLMHEFTYQAMVYDLLPIQSNDQITIQAPATDNSDNNNNNSQTTKTLILNDNDKLWTELRTKHIADVLDILSTRIRETVNSNAGVVASSSSKNNSQGAKNLTTKQLANVMRSIPEYREILSSLYNHMQIAQMCMKQFNALGLIDVSELEQTCATGKSEEDVTPKLAAFVSQLEQSLSNINNPRDRFRLLTIFIASQNGLQSEDVKRRLFAAAKLSPSDVKAIQSLEFFGIPIVKSSGTNKLMIRSNMDSQATYNNNRYICDLKIILQQLQSSKLSMEDYPSVLPMPLDSYSDSSSSNVQSSNGRGITSLRGTSSRFSKASNSMLDKSSIGGGGGSKGPRQIVFIAGGACYSELRAVQESMEKGGPETILGGTKFLNPEEFYNDLVS